MEFSLKKSFKSQGSYKHSRKLSSSSSSGGGGAGGGGASSSSDPTHNEHLPILSHDHEEDEEVIIDDTLTSVRPNTNTNTNTNTNNNNETLILTSPRYQHRRQQQQLPRPHPLHVIDINHHVMPRTTPPPSPHQLRGHGDGGAAEVIVKVDKGPDEDKEEEGQSTPVVQREPSFNFKQGASSGHHHQDDDDDPTSRLIGQFLNRQRNDGSEISLDMDMEMDELRRTNNNNYIINTTCSSSNNNDYSNLLLHPMAESPTAKSSRRTSREIRVSFEPSFFSAGGGATSSSTPPPSDSDSAFRRRPSTYNNNSKDSPHGTVNSEGRAVDPDVLRCTSNASFRNPTRNLTRLKTKSRLLDPPEEVEKLPERIPKHSTQFKSGLLSRVVAGGDEEEEDPLDIEDLPDDYKKAHISTLTILQWVGLILIMGALICTLTIPALKKMDLLNLELWKWEVLCLVLICGRLVSGWGIRILVFFIERNFLLRKRVLYFVYGLRKGVQNCLWLGLVLLAWHLLFDKKLKRETKGKSDHFLKYFTKILICFVVANFIWLVKILLVKVLASSFHVSTYFDRIQESLFYQFVIQTLSGPPLVELQRNEKEMERTAAEVIKLQNAGATIPPELRAAVFPSTYRSGRMIGGASGGLQKSFKTGKSFKLSRQLTRKGEKSKGANSSPLSSSDDAITIDQVHKLNTKNVSAWNMKKLMNIIRRGALSTLDEQILGANDESATEIRSEHQAKAAARKIFYNVARPGSKYINLEDLMRFMREDEAIKTMSLFEGASDSGRISKGALKNWVVNAFRERRALALTLNDTKTAVNRLHHLVNVVVGILIIAIWLVILGIASSKFLVFLGSQLVVVSFIFGNTVKTLFECIIFLFFVHPFDVGDRCEVDSVQLVVEEMNILTTVFLRGDNQKIVFPNSILFTKPIGNFYRSPDMGDAIEFFVHISTPLEKIALMKQRIISYINENKKEHWYPNPMVIMKEQEDLNKLRMAVWMRHRINHQDMGEKWGRRALLLEEMVKIFKDLDIQYRLYPLDINVRTMPPNLNSTYVSPPP